MGRTEDEVNFEGHIRVIENIYSMLKRWGKFYFSVPIGNKQLDQTYFRIFSMQYLLDLFGERFHVSSFSYIDDRGDLYENKILYESDIKNNLDCDFGCGIFELVKLLKLITAISYCRFL